MPTEFGWPTAAEVQSYLTQKGVAPKVADLVLRIQSVESPSGREGDGPEQGGPSYGPWQLHYAGGPNPVSGMGDSFTRDNPGFHASDPKTWQRQVDYIVDKIAPIQNDPAALANIWHGLRGATGDTRASAVGGRERPPYPTRKLDPRWLEAVNAADARRIAAVERFKEAPSYTQTWVDQWNKENPGAEPKGHPAGDPALGPLDYRDLAAREAYDAKYADWIPNHDDFVDDYIQNHPKEVLDPFTKRPVIGADGKPVTIDPLAAAEAAWKAKRDAVQRQADQAAKDVDDARAAMKDAQAAADKDFAQSMDAYNRSFKDNLLIRVGNGDVSLPEAQHLWDQASAAQTQLWKIEDAEIARANVEADRKAKEAQAALDRTQKLNEAIATTGQSAVKDMLPYLAPKGTTAALNDTLNSWNRRIPGAQPVNLATQTTSMSQIRDNATQSLRDILPTLNGAQAAYQATPSTEQPTSEQILAVRTNPRKAALLATIAAINPSGLLEEEEDYASPLDSPSPEIPEEPPVESGPPQVVMGQGLADIQAALQSGDYSPEQVVDLLGQQEDEYARQAVPS